MSLSFVRRIGVAPQDRKPGPNSPSTSTTSCPDLWELDSGEFAVIGTDHTDALRGNLPLGVSIHEHERILVVPRELITKARPDIPAI